MPPMMPPTSMDRARRRGAKGITLCRAMEVTMPEKAPRLIKPAWPRDSSPRMPTVRFRATAITI